MKLRELTVDWFIKTNYEAKSVFIAAMTNGLPGFAN